MSEKEYAVRPNKTQIKREIRVLNKLGKELAGLPDSALKKIPLSDVMRREIADAKRFSRGALQRQLRRIAGLLQDEDLDAIHLELTRQKNPTKQQTEQFHQLEQWRDRLIVGDEKLLTELINQFATIDRQMIRQLVRNAAREKKMQQAPKSARALFKYLAELRTSTPTEENGQDDNPSSVTS